MSTRVEKVREAFDRLKERLAAGEIEPVDYRARRDLLIEDLTVAERAELGLGTPMPQPVAGSRRAGRPDPIGPSGGVGGGARTALHRRALADFRPGVTILDQWRLERELGRGGFGVVFEATELHLGQKQAVKVLDPGMVENADLLARFRREVLVTRRLVHPHIVRVFDYRESPQESLALLSMEFVSGCSLRDFKDLAKAEKRLVGVSQVLTILGQTLEALAAAHAEGVVHRDVSPGNVLLGGGSARELLDDPARNPQVKLVDFGIAGLAERTELSVNDRALGTSAYVAPEVHDLSMDVTPAADVYSAGAVAYELLTRTLPHFGSRDPESFRPELSREANELLLSLLKPQPPDRPEARHAAMTVQALLAQGAAEQVARERVSKLEAELAEALAADDEAVVASCAVQLERELLSADSMESLDKAKSWLAEKQRKRQEIEAAQRRASEAEQRRKTEDRRRLEEETRAQAAAEELSALALEAERRRENGARFRVEEEARAQAAGEARRQQVEEASRRAEEDKARHAAQEQQRQDDAFHRRIEAQRQRELASAPARSSTSSSAAVSKPARGGLSGAAWLGIALLVILVIAVIAWGAAQKGKAAASGSSQPATTVAPSAESGPTSLRWVRLPSGSFTMGCTSGDTTCKSSESPPHRVTISRDFALAETETTAGQYQACVSSGRCTAPQGVQGGNDHPVVYVDWNQSKAFCEWAGGRLPSEAEWEYAARGGREGWKYPWGNSISHENANYGTAGCCKGLASGRDQWEQTSPVKSFAANGYGLYDMSGNVWEWVSDPWHDSYSGAPSEGSTWSFGGNASQRVLRGASWYNSPGGLRASFRFSVVTDLRDNNVGFRCARSEITKANERESKVKEQLRGPEPAPVSQNVIEAAPTSRGASKPLPVDERNSLAAEAPPPQLKEPLPIAPGEPTPAAVPPTQPVSTWRDPQTGLVWTAKSSGDDVSWKEAKEICESLAAGVAGAWRLPALSELEGIYLSTSSQRLKIRGEIELTGASIWSGEKSEEKGYEAGWYFAFGNGKRGWNPTHLAVNRALCVSDQQGPSAPKLTEVTGGSQPAMETGQSRQPPGTWLDTRTNLLWTARDNGADINWHSAKHNCDIMELGGFSDWRLPHIGELEGMYDFGAKKKFRIRGEVELSNAWVWSADSVSSDSGPVWQFPFTLLGGNRSQIHRGDTRRNRALCVRASGG